MGHTGVFVGIVAEGQDGKQRSPHSTARWADIRQMIILPVPSPKDSKDSASSKSSQGCWAGAPRLRTIPVADPGTNLSPGGGEKAAGCWWRHSRAVSLEIEGCNGPAAPKFTRKLQGSAELRYPGTKGGIPFPLIYNTLEIRALFASFSPLRV